MSIFEKAKARLNSKRYERLKSLKKKAKIESQKYPYATYQGKDPIDGTDIVKAGANEPVSGFKLISNAPVEKGDCVALRKNNQGGLQRVDDLNRPKIVEQQTTLQTFSAIYLLRELSTNSLYVSDGVRTEEMAVFNVFSTESSTGISGTITKTGTGFNDWIVTGLYAKNETPSSVTENRLVSFYLTPFEELEEEVKYLAEDVVNRLIFEQHEEAQETYDEERAIVLAAQAAALDESGLLVDLSELEAELLALQIALSEATTPEEIAAINAQIAIVEAEIVEVEAEIAEIEAPFIAQLSDLFDDLQAALDKDLILSNQFRVGETVYSSTDNFSNPIVVTATNDAGGALTTRFAVGVDVGYGWIVSYDRLKDGSDRFEGSNKNGAFLYRGRLNTSSLPSTAPDNDSTGDMATSGYYTLGTYEGDPALVLRPLVDPVGSPPIKIRFFRDVLAESIDDLIDLSTETIQNTVYDSVFLGFIPIGGGDFLYAYSPPDPAILMPIQETIALVLFGENEFTYTDVYFNQKENFVRRKMYEFSMTADHDADVWLNEERMITQKVGYRYIQGYEAPTEEDPDNFVRSGFKHFRAIGTDIRQGFENETQLFRRSLDTVGTRESESLKADAFYVDNSGDQNLVEQTDYFDEEPEERVLSIPLNGNLINNELVFLVLDILDGTINQLQKTIDLSSSPLEEVEETERIIRIDDQLYSILSYSTWLAG
jgi:hypothetical protein